MLAERMPDLTLAGPVRLRNTTTIRGPLHLPVTVSGRPGSGRPGPGQPDSSAGKVGMSAGNRLSSRP
jgi:hypothetical protein